MRELPRNGVAFSLGAFGGGRPRHGAGGHPPLQIPAGAVVRAVSRRPARPRGETCLERATLGFHRARSAVSGETARTRIQPGGAAGKSFERGDRDSVEPKIAPAGHGHGNPDPAYARATIK